MRSFFLQDFQNIKSIKKIKSITPIDDDLALQMKEEIENAKGLLNTVNNRLDPDPPVDETDPDADFQMYDMNKIRRIKSEFSVEDLDDIDEIVKIDSAEANRLENYGAGNAPLDAEGENPFEGENSDESDSGFDTFDLENSQLHKIDKELDRLKEGKEEVEGAIASEKKYITALMKMMKAEMKKLRSIKAVLADHEEKHGLLHGDLNDILDQIKDLQMKKIKHLQMLRDAAEQRETDAVHIINSAEKEQELEPWEMGDMGDVDTEMKIEGVPDDDEPTEPKFGYENEVEEEEEELIDDTGMDGTHKEIDSSKYDIFPLKKILSMKKIKSITVS